MSAIPSILDALRGAVGFEASGPAAGNLTVGRGDLGGRAIRVGLIESRIASGSIGVLEAQGLIALFGDAAQDGTPLVLYIDSAGARVSEGLLALGGFRNLYREGLAAALGGVPIAAVLGRNCFGGASMLAYLARARLFGPTTRLGMSGPAVIAGAEGKDPRDAGFVASAEAVFAGRSRATTSGDNTSWQGDDIRPWLKRALGDGAEAAGYFRSRHDALGRRLPADELHGAGAERVSGDGRERRIALAGKHALDAARAWRFADAVWGLCADPPARLEVLLDCASHAPSLEGEKRILTEYIVDMAFALGALAARGTQVGLTVTGQAGGGVYVALAAPAQRVASVAGAADIQVLPIAAVTAILGEGHASAPSFSEYRSAGVADEELQPGLVPPMP